MGRNIPLTYRNRSEIEHVSILSLRGFVVECFSVVCEWWWCVDVLLTEDWFNGNSVEGGMALWLPLGTHAGTVDLVCVEIVHSKKHCKKDKHGFM